MKQSESGWMVYKQANFSQTESQLFNYGFLITSASACLLGQGHAVELTQAGARLGVIRGAVWTEAATYSVLLRLASWRRGPGRPARPPFVALLVLHGAEFDELLRALGWQHITDFGGLEAICFIEPLVLLWVHYGVKTGDWHHAHALKFVKW